MSKVGFPSRIPMPVLMLMAAMLLAPALMRADDFSFGGGSGCSDPPIFSQVFSFSANSSGGECLAFGNHSGTPFDSVSITTTTPDSLSSLICDGGSFFEFCSFSVDTVHNTLSINFFGLDGTHQGIPVAPGCSLSTDCVLPNNFSINLNDLVCDANNLCTQPTSDDGSGGWKTGGVADVFTATANGVPEPASMALLVTALGAIVARKQFVKRRQS